MSALQTTLRARISSMVLIVTIVALCFSVGEGLHLTPFPVSESLANVPSTGSTLGSSRLLVVYGPLDVPVQQQKRNTRLSVDLLCPAVPYNLTHITQRSFALPERTSIVSNNLLVSLPTDRGPPFTS